MRCKNCDYRLWNLTSRQCPECGTPFRPSQYEFVANSVQFCCPHCGQAYYGTGSQGHVVPAEFDCVSCRKRLHMDEMVLLPTSGVEEERTEVDQMPWLERKKRGALRAWFAMIGMALTAPGRLMRTVPEQSSAGQAFWFASFTTALILSVSFAPFIAVPMVMAFVFSGRGGGAGAMGAAAGFGIAFVVTVLATAATIAVWALATHGLLRLTGKTAGRLGRTFHGICYSSGANVISAVPCLGLYFGWIWWLISAVIMVKEAQRVSGVRAAFGVLAFPVLSIAVLIVAYVALIATVLLSPAGLRAQRGAAPVWETQLVLDELLKYARGHAGAGPDHAMQLVVDGRLTTSNLVLAASRTRSRGVPVGGVTLDQFNSFSRDQERAACAAAIKALPEGTLAHRVGDFVFTHHGIRLDKADPRLWVVIASPDPDANASPSFSEHIMVGRADGSVMEVSADTLAANLAEQNATRAKHGLPPLPDPSTITHSRPAAERAEAPDDD